MYLKTLEIQGFKSFVEKTALAFHAGLTAVVGPNGSGKSNIADAVRWVLGEQSAKTLRGGKMEDVIFSGTQHRKALSFAAVSIVFDNTDGTLPIDFTEITVTRRIFRSGESEYLLNKTPCRLKDIHELFMNTGIGREGYSIIGQGRIDEILSTRSEERRSVFEEAAGITKYKARRREAERRLEATRLNMERISDIIATLEEQIEPLFQQSETAKAYLSLSEELRGIEVAFMLESVDKAQLRLAEIISQQSEIRKAIEKENNSLSEISKRNSQRSEKLEGLRKAREEAELAVHRIESEKEKAKHQIQLEEEKIRNLRQINVSFGSDLAGLEARILSMGLDIERKKNRNSALYRDQGRFLKEQEEAEAELARVLVSLTGSEKEAEECKEQVMQLQDTLSELRISLQAAKSNLQNIAEQERKHANELLEYGRETDRLSMLREELESALRSNKTDISSLKDKLNAAELDYSEIKSGAEALRSRKEALARDHGAKNSRYHVLQDLENSMEGYAHSVKSLLSACRKNRELLSGICGALAQLVEIRPHFEIALEICLGAALQNIVIETEDDASKAIDFLKKNNMGRATFLPISAIRARKLEGNILHIAETIDGYLGTADEFVKCEPEFRDIIKNLLARTIVAEDMNSGIILARRFEHGIRIVTRQGELFNVGGSMSGGSQPARNASILGRQRLMHELSEEMKNIAMEIDKVEAARQEKGKKAQDVNELIVFSRNKLSELELARMRDENRRRQIDEQLQLLKDKKLKNREEALAFNERESAIKKAISKETADQELIVAKIAELKANIQQKQTMAKDEQRARDIVREDLNLAKVSLLSVIESIAANKEQISALEEELSSLKISISRRSSDKKSNEELISDATARTEGWNNRLIQLAAEKTGLELRSDASEEDLRVAEEEYSGLIEAITIHNQEILSYQEEFSRLEARSVKHETEKEQVYNRLWDEYGLTVATAEPYRRPVENQKLAQSSIAELKGKIRALGTVNVAAVEDYAKTMERHNFMATQLNDLVQSESKLCRVIQEITKVMKQQFLEQFALINKNFSDVFRELFEGGAAEVIITNTEEILDSDIEIHVQPPGKKLQNMMLLSGGERALVAISLIFAILRMRPSPFYLLDEIEASLDDANVFKFADHIKRYTDSIQFLCITHRKGTMEAADILYGVTMQEHGVSKVVSMRMDKAT